MISPFPSHPQNAGSNIRIFRLASCLREMGHEVHFCYLKTSDDCDMQGMSEYWGRFLYCVPSLYPQRSLLRRVLAGVKRYFGLHLYFLDDWYYSIDDWYPAALDLFISRLANEQAFDVVLVEYVFFSRAFNHFGKNVLKIIDTHDAFANRHRRYEKINQNGRYLWFTATPRGEACGLSRADVVIAIQKEEEKIFKQLVTSKVVTIGHLLASRHSSSTDSNAHELLFVGTLTKDNELGVAFFMEEILPRIQSRYPDAKLLICGKICNVIADSPHCIKLGVVEDVSTAYERAGVVVNPAYLGTGLAIKSIEALSYGKPLVTTPQGARGLEEGRDHAFLVGHTAEDFSRHVIQLFDDIDFRKKLSVRAHEFARSYQADNLNKLAMIVKYAKSEK